MFQRLPLDLGHATSRLTDSSKAKLIFMKKLLTLSVLIAAAASVQAQGTINASNAGAFGVRPVYVETVGGALAGTSVMVELWAGATENSLALLKSGSILANGLFGLGTIAIPDVALGGTAIVQVRAWDTAKGATYDASTLRGFSDTFSVVTGGAGSPATTPAALGNFQSFAIVTVPEPATLALAGIGGFGLLAMRRKQA